MINCNPETVSTDYDRADRLYFEPLTAEDVMEIIHHERRSGVLRGVNIQFGGQTPLRLAKMLAEAGIPILGTSPDAIDLAEDRARFADLLKQLGIQQPESQTYGCVDDIYHALETGAITFPVMARPSYVLGGQSMAILYHPKDMRDYLESLPDICSYGPLLLDRYLDHAIEVDVDALCDGVDVYIPAIMQHVEEAGIHSGDSACVIPPYSLSDAMQQAIRSTTDMLGRALGVRGLMNIQYAVDREMLYVLEVNPRASRTVPFVAKATGMAVAHYAARLMLGEHIADVMAYWIENPPVFSYVAVKQSVFPFDRFPLSDVVLGPEMKSTGEVMGWDIDFPRAFAKAQLAANRTIPTEGMVFLSVKDADKPAILDLARQFVTRGFSLCATGGTALYLSGHGLAVTHVNKVRQGSPHIVDHIQSGTIALIVNTTQGVQSLADSFSIRRTALAQRIPCITSLPVVYAWMDAMIACQDALRAGRSMMDIFSFEPLQERVPQLPLLPERCLS